jgi:uncharacterized GH25 family protein
MIRMMTASLVLLFATMVAQAHMVYLVPSEDGQSVTVVFSDSLNADEKVTMDKLAGLKLITVIDGKASPTEFTKNAHSFSTKLGQKNAVIHGSATYGLLTKAEKPTLLVYHPKTVVGTATAAVGEAAALEIVPETAAGQTRFRLLAKGKPVANAEGSVMLPDGSKEKVTTDAEGFTAKFAKTGRYAAYMKLVEAKAGEHDGKKYEEVRHYATLVADVK